MYLTFLTCGATICENEKFAPNGKPCNAAPTIAVGLSIDPTVALAARVGSCSHMHYCLKHALAYAADVLSR